LARSAGVTSDRHLALFGARTPPVATQAWERWPGVVHAVGDTTGVSTRDALAAATFGTATPVVNR
jgi:hypothetical protein